MIDDILLAAEQVYAVVETQLTYLRSIGAIGPPADPPPADPPPGGRV